MPLFSRLVWTILIHVLLEENSHLRYHSGIWDFTIYQLHFWMTLCYCISSSTLRTMPGHCIPNPSALWIVYCSIGIVTCTHLLKCLGDTILLCCFLHLWGWSLNFANYMWTSCQMLQKWNNSCLSQLFMCLDITFVTPSESKCLDVVDPSSTPAVASNPWGRHDQGDIPPHVNPKVSCFRCGIFFYCLFILHLLLLCA